MSSLKDIKQLLACEHVLLRIAFMRFLRQVRSPQVLAAITKTLRQGDQDHALAIIQDYLQEFLDAMSQSFVRSANAEIKRARGVIRMKHLTRLVGKSVLQKVGEDDLWASIDVSFDSNDAQAARLMNKLNLDFLQDFSTKQKNVIRTALARSLRNGESYAAAARSIRDTIGLTETQWQAVNNYRSLLEGGSSEALQRQLRDRRFDNTVMNSIMRGDILNEDQIDRMVDSYTQRMLAFRADTIASTESHAVLSLARRQAWEQIVDKLDLDEESFERTWNTTEDGRERDTHHEMNGQVVTGFDPYVSPSGAQLAYPGDPSAPAEERVRCRCVETYELH